MSNEYCERLQAHVVWRGEMGELLRIGFVSLGALGIIGYLVYVALTEETFH